MSFFYEHMMENNHSKKKTRVNNERYSWMGGSDVAHSCSTCVLEGLHTFICDSSQYTPFSSLDFPKHALGVSIIPQEVPRGECQIAPRTYIEGPFLSTTLARDDVGKKQVIWPKEACPAHAVPP